MSKITRVFTENYITLSNSNRTSRPTCRPKYTAEPGSFHRENGVLENSLLALQSWLVGKNTWKGLNWPSLPPNDKRTPEAHSGTDQNKRRRQLGDLMANQRRLYISISIIILVVI